MATQETIGSLPAQLPTLGDTVEGVIIAQEPGRLFIDLGTAGTGIVYGREFLLAREFIRSFKKGDTVRAKVVEVDNEDGYTELSLQEAGKEMVWQKLRERMEQKQVFPVTVASANRGGLVADIEGFQAFLPVSQLAPEHYPRVEGGDKDRIFQELQRFVNKTLQVTVLDLDPNQDKLIISEREAAAQALVEKMQNYHAGDVISGVISGIVDFGVFIRFGEDKDLEGLAHISELDWGLVEDPKQLFAQGQEIQAKIIDLESGRASLSIKALKKDPWEAAAEKFKRGDTADGRVVRLNPFGAFVEVAPGIQGLAHIAEFKTVEKMKEALKIGETYQFRIAAIEPKEHRMSLKPLREHGESAEHDGPDKREDVEGAQELETEVQ